MNKPKLTPWQKQQLVINAAPELLAALERLIEEMNPFISDADSCECGDSEDDGVCAHMQAFRAIAKAKGGAS